MAAAAAAYLAQAVHALEETEEDGEPGDGQADDELPADRAQLFHTRRYLQHLVAVIQTHTHVVTAGPSY